MVARLVVAAEVARVGKAAVTRHILERERGATHQRLGFFEADALENRFRAGFADLPEEATQVARGNVNRIGDFLHRRIAREVFGVPREGALDFEGGEVGERGRLARYLVGEGERGKVHEATLENDGADEIRLTEMRFDFGGNGSEADDFGVGELFGKPAAGAHDFVERIGDAAEVENDAVVFVPAVVDPSVGALGRKDPQGFFVERGGLVVAESRPGASIDDRIEFPVGAGVAHHGIFPAETTVREIAEHGVVGPDGCGSHTRALR